MKEILEKVQQIQRDLLGKKTVYVDVHAFESSLNIHVAVFADNNDSDDKKPLYVSGRLHVNSS